LDAALHGANLTSQIRDLPFCPCRLVHEALPPLGDRLHLRLQRRDLAFVLVPSLSEQFDRSVRGAQPPWPKRDPIAGGLPTLVLPVSPSVLALVDARDGNARRKGELVRPDTGPIRPRPGLLAVDLAERVAVDSLDLLLVLVCAFPEDLRAGVVARD